MANRRIHVKLELVIDVEPGESNEDAIASFLAQTDVSQGWQIVGEEKNGKTT